MPTPPSTTAELWLTALARYGIDVLYVGAGTDTAPLIEAYAAQDRSGHTYPQAVLAVTENIAVSMAHGYYLACGRPQAVMLHVSVGTASAICAVMTAARAQIPLLFSAGRTPLFEDGAFGARSHDIHWGQEMFDQAAMLRELVKWDYELRDGLQAEQVVGRAHSVAMTQPRGPVYVSLPREVLARPVQPSAARAVAPPATQAHADPQQVARLARALAEARLPVIVCTASGIDTATVPALQALAERFGIGVAESRPKYMNFPDAHPLHLGFAPELLFDDADVLLFLECDVPWIPTAAAPRDDAFIAHAGCDPLFQNYPMRSFRSDLSLTSDTAALLRALSSALEAAGAERGAAARRSAIEARAQATRGAERARCAAELGATGPINKAFLSACLGELADTGGPALRVFNEYPLVRSHLPLQTPGTFFELPSSGGLGWALPAAMGMRQALPDATVVCVVGDGAYLFSNPAACHHQAAMLGLPVLTVIYNNQRWAAVANASLRLYPQGAAAASSDAQGGVPLSSLAPVPRFELHAEASGGHAERVTERAELLPALQRALRVVREEGRQALVNVLGS